DPVVDSAATLGSLIETARAEAEIPVGFLAAITKGQTGAELTEMGELADAGAAAFTDDGIPVASPGLMRRALQYSAVTRRRIAVHCEESTLSRGGQMHEGEVSAELGFAGYPSVAESLMVERDLAPHARHEKEVPFEAAPFGVTGLETAFAALYTHLVEPGVVSLETILERMSTGPARAYGLAEPRIAVGAPANVVLLDLKASYSI